MNRSPDQYIKEPYTRILIPNEDGSYSAEILEFPGCFAEGETANEAMENLEDAAKSWLAGSIERGLDIPAPFNNQDFGGKIALRLPRSLHRQASRMAERDGISLNQFLVSAISARIGAEDFYAHLMDKFEQSMTASWKIVWYRGLNAVSSNKSIDLQLTPTSVASLPPGREVWMEKPHA